MIDKIKVKNGVDKDGNPAGGAVKGTGLSITWQHKPLGRGEKRLKPTGAFVETVLAAVKQRIEHYQKSKFASAENAEAIKAIDAALAALDLRTKRREAQGVEGTHAAHAAHDQKAPEAAAAPAVVPGKTPEAPSDSAK